MPRPDDEYDDDDDDRPLRSARRPSTWTEDAVDPDRPHIRLSWPGGRWEKYREQAAVARFAPVPGETHAFVAELLTPPTLAPHHLAQAHEQARAKLDFYLIELEEPNPWRYAIYHCGSTSNAYSSVTWSYVDPAKDDPHTAHGGVRLVKLAGDEIVGSRGLADDAADADWPTLSIPTHCPSCGTPPTHDRSARCFRCPSCAWHD